MKKITLSLFCIFIAIFAFGCNKGNSKNEKFTGTYTYWNDDEQTGKIIIFYDNDFVLMDIASDIVLSKKFSYRKDGDTYYVKLIASYSDFGWENEESSEEQLSFEDMGDMLIIEGLTYTNWESLYGSVAEEFEQGIETFFEGTWTDYYTSNGEENDVISFSGDSYSTNSGFSGTFAYKDTTLSFAHYDPVPTYILDKNHFASIPDTDGEAICLIYERIE